MSLLLTKKNMLCSIKKPIPDHNRGWAHQTRTKNKKLSVCGVFLLRRDNSHIVVCN